MLERERERVYVCMYVYVHRTVRVGFEVYYIVEALVIELRPGGQVMSMLPLALCRAEIKLRNVWFIPLLKNCVSVIGPQE